MANLPSLRLPQTGSAGLLSVVEDTTPELGGELSCNGFGITGFLKLGNAAWASKTISSGAVVADKSLLKIDGEGSAADELVTITHESGVDWILIRIANASNDITLKHNTGNVFLLSEADLTLGETESIVLLIWNPDDSKWGVIAGGGGGSGSVDTSGSPEANDISRFVDEDTIEGISYAELLAAISVAAGADVTAVNETSHADVLVDGDVGSVVQAFNALLADIAVLTLAQGDVLYFNGTEIVNLGPGTSGYFLQTQGAGANPVWAEAAGGGGTSTPMWIQWE